MSPPGAQPRHQQAESSLPSSQRPPGPLQPPPQDIILHYQRHLRSVSHGGAMVFARAGARSRRYASGRLDTACAGPLPEDYGAMLRRLEKAPIRTTSWPRIPTVWGRTEEAGQEPPTLGSTPPVPRQVLTLVPYPAPAVLALLLSYGLLVGA